MRIAAIVLMVAGLIGVVAGFESVGNAATLPSRGHIAMLAGDGSAPPPAKATPTRPIEQPTATPTQAVPTATPTQAPPTATPQPSGIYVQHFSSYTDSIGALWIVGEVVNGLSADAEFVQITANYYGQSGVLLATETGYADLTVVPAGGDSPFSVLTFEPPAGIARYTLQVTDYTSPPFGSDAPTSGLAASITNTYVDSINFVHFVGTVTNNSARSYDFVNPIIAFYDGAGTVIRIEDAFTSPSTLGPGQTGSFEALLDADGVSFTSYRVWVDASQ
ncbi:MAG: FxLYD domain-containing protein [Tepidiformaceae bacterium]